MVGKGPVVCDDRQSSIMFCLYCCQCPRPLPSVSRVYSFEKRRFYHIKPSRNLLYRSSKSGAGRVSNSRSLRLGQLGGLSCDTCTYSTYYKPMGDLPYSSSEQGGLIYEYTMYKRSIPIQELKGVGL